MSDVAFETPERKLRTIRPILRDAYGPRKLVPNGEPLTELVTTILSQNTSDVNTARSWQSLHERFPNWDAMRKTPVAEVIAAISSGGLSQTKGPRIQAVLRETLNRLGSDDLSPLADMAVGDARSWLVSLHGVGSKTASCVLLFALGKPAMPVDTHVHRVSLRLGLVAPRTSPESTGVVLEAALGNDPHAIYAVHMGLIQHGRKVCVARRPRCPICPLRSHCDYFQQLPT